MSSLLDYLHENFYTTRQLLGKSGVSQERLFALQHEACMPMPSYSLSMRVGCQSFFGEYEEVQQQDFYAQAYVAWLIVLVGLETSTSLAQQAYAVFHQRYVSRVGQLFEQGLRPAKFCASTDQIDVDRLNEHVAAEWISFLKGTYGLCTKSGLPEDIADKEVASLLIDEITDRQCKVKLEGEEAVVLVQAVKKLDQAASQFAPHERSRSSRQRCIEGVIEKYQLIL
ncbi:DUF6058 family natural product biosynthesis protein [Undibacterium terreum]|uniref:Orphan protein n=1 Tax=Undibacterium terreum TaxID=1224302 RepID=A0A916UN20_9BURK|nr:DUF6058 family natural product biosynthesis protein [Undibacterium terreum]GGC78658.1 hypothetical protein GCM10011396_27320 [Undibacterium terreum]